MSRTRPGVWIAVGALAVLAGFPMSAGNAQPLPPQAQNVNITQSLPTQGGWAQVIMVDSRWIVLQDERRRQFPMRFDAAKVFLMRWPTTLADVSPTGLVEAHGATLASNGLATNHIDVYEGSDRSLVRVTGTAHQDFVASYTMSMVGGANSFGGPFPSLSFFPMFGAPAMVPMAAAAANSYVVGRLLAVDPIQVSTDGNIAMTIQAADLGGITVTQVTRGAASAVEKGDIAFFMPNGATAKSLEMNMLIIYKKIPVAMFNTPVDRRR